MLDGLYYAARYISMVAMRIALPLALLERAGVGWKALSIGLLSFSDGLTLDEISEVLGGSRRQISKRLDKFRSFVEKRRKDWINERKRAPSSGGRHG